MHVRRIVPDISSERLDESREFYSGFLGLDVAMDMGWIMTFVSPDNPTAQVIVLSKSNDESASVAPDLTVEVADVDAAHAQAVRRGLQIAYPLTDESWGVRRFFVMDPNGVVVNLMCHRSSATSG
jgi:catechol 2,3-dioxygenase-like lactoylglutathione lyase family enzyme